jgi:type I restriction enzyme, S subunit
VTPRRVRVGDVLKLERRPVEPEPTKEYVSIGVRSFGKGIFHYEPVQGDRLGKLRFFEVVPDRLVVSNIKGWEGAVALSTDADADCIASNRFLSYTPIGSRIDVRWARWYFLSDAGNELLQQASPGSADRNRTLAIDRFEALEIPLPQIDDQRHVAQRLDGVEVLAAELRRRAERAVELGSALAVSIAARPDLDEPAKNRAGWRTARLGSAMRLADSPVTVEPDESYPNVGIYSFGRGLFKKPDIDGSSTSATTLYRIKAGEFIYSRLFAFEGAYACVSSEFDGHFVSNEFPAFETDPEQLDARWLASFFRSPERWAELRGRSKGLGVRRQRVPVEAVLDYEVWLPPMTAQRAMVAAIEGLEKASAARQAALQRIDALLPAALNDAFAPVS